MVESSFSPTFWSRFIKYQHFSCKILKSISMIMNHRISFSFTKSACEKELLPNRKLRKIGASGIKMWRERQIFIPRTVVLSRWFWRTYWPIGIARWEDFATISWPCLIRRNWTHSRSLLTHKLWKKLSKMSDSRWTILQKVLRKIPSRNL